MFIVPYATACGWPYSVMQSFVSYALYAPISIRQLTRTCGLDETCVLCQYCFNPDDHRDHQVTVSISQRDCGGVCDCGDPEAWVRHFSCKYMEPKTTSNIQIPKELYDAIKSTIDVVLDYTIDILCNANTAVQKYKYAGQVLENEDQSRLSQIRYGVPDVETNGKYTHCIWNDQKHSFDDVINAIFHGTGKSHRFAEMVTHQIDKNGRGVVYVSRDVVEMMRRKIAMEQTGLVNTIRSSRDYFREEMCGTIISWLDDISRSAIQENFSILRDIICLSLCESWQYGTEALCEQPWATEPRKSRVSLMDYKSQLLGPYIPGFAGEEFDSYFNQGDSHDDGNARDPRQPPMQYEEVPTSGVIQGGRTESAITDIVTVLETTPEYFSEDGEEVFKDDPSKPLRTKRGPYVVPKHWREEITQNKPRQISARVQYLIFFDIRLWKSVRLTLRDLYITVLVSNQDYKLQLGHLYAEIYPQIVELYMLADREPECSIINNLSTQLFTTPTIASELVRYDYYTRFVAALYTFFTTGEVDGPGYVDRWSGISTSQKILSNRRFGQLFHDIEYMLNRNTEKQLISGNPNRIMQATDFILLFQGMSPVTRQKDSHVEYESEDWIYIFNAIPYVLQFGQAVAMGLSVCPPEIGHECVQLVSNVINEWAFGYYLSRFRNTEIDEDSPPDRERIRITFGKTVERTIISFKAEEFPVSLHHPLHVYLSWLVESVRFNSAKDLRSALITPEPRRAQDFDGWSEEEMLGLLFDHPLRVLGLLSQIQVGLWVRNGFSLRSQLHHYKEITLRDSAFARDLFCAQISLVVREPESSMITFLSRWSLSSWEAAKKLLDETQVMYMVEEFLHHLIALIMERTHLMGLSDTECKKKYITREIIQCLGMHNMSFSEMCKNIPDILTSDEMFEGILKEVANFKPPKGIRDIGMYELKQDYYQYFDTHYIHFSSAKIEEAETVIKNKIHKVHGKPLKEIVHEPPLEPLDNGPFVGIAEFTRTETFARFCYDLLRFILNKETRSQYESTLGHLLQLFHVGILDDLQENYESSLPSFVEQMCRVVPTSDLHGQCILSMLCEILKIESFADRHAKIKRIIHLFRTRNRLLVDDTLSRYSSQLVSDFSQEDRDTDSETEATRKKKLAEEKRQKVLLEFRKQQELFAANNLEDNGDDDEEMIDDEDLGATNSEWPYPESHCILCRMPDEEGYVFGLMGYVTESNVFRDVPFQDADWIYEAYGCNSNLDEEIKPEDTDSGSPGWETYRKNFHDQHKIGPGFPTEKTSRHSVVTGCGHGIHYHCFEDYVQMTKNRGQQLTRNNPEDTNKGEYLCPLCKSLNNIFLPVMWKSNSRNLTVFKSINQDFSSFLGTLEQIDNMNEPSKERLIYLSNGIVTSASSHLMPQFADAFNVEDEAPVNSLNLAMSALCNSLKSIVQKAMGDYVGSSTIDTDAVLGFLDCLTFSVSNLEISLRGKKLENPFGGLLLDQIPNQSLQIMRVQGELCKSLLAVVRTSPYLLSKNVHGAGAFSNVSMDELLKMEELGSSSDCFSDLVRSILVACPTYELEPNHYLRKYFMNEICNILVAIVDEVQAGSNWVTNPLLFELPCLEGFDDETLLALNVLVESIRASIEDRTTPNMYIWSKPTFIKVVYSMLVKSLLPFLRMSSIFVHALCGVGYDSEDYMALEVDTEGDKLCQFLSLPPVNKILKTMADHDSVERRLVQKWCAEKFQRYREEGHRLQYPGVIRLLRLPYRLDEFFNLENHSYPNGELPPDPAVCLFCGESVGMQIPLYLRGNKKGQCTNHVQNCGKTCGIFLLPKRSSILLLRSEQGSFMEGPYLDIHGESDEVMK